MEADWPLIAEGLAAALAALKAMRLQEGAFLRGDLSARMQAVAQQVALIRQRLPQMLTDYLQRLEQRLKEWFERVALDAARLAQEAVLFAERGDVTEELTRLEAHLQATQTLLASGETVGPQGRFSGAGNASRDRNDRRQGQRPDDFALRGGDQE